MLLSSTLPAGVTEGWTSTDSDGRVWGVSPGAFNLGERAFSGTANTDFAASSLVGLLGRDPADQGDGTNDSSANANAQIPNINLTATASDVRIAGGTTINAANGTDPGQVTLTGSNTEFKVNQGQTLDNLTVTFDLGMDMDIASVLVQNRVAIAEPKLPEDVKRQGVVTKKKSTSPHDDPIRKIFNKLGNLEQELKTQKSQADRLEQQLKKALSSLQFSPMMSMKINQVVPHF